MELFFSFVNSFVSLLFKMMHNLEIGAQPGIVKYLYTYWFLFFAYGIILVVYDLIIHFIRYDMIARLHSELRCYRSLRFMTLVAETYYIIDKVLEKLLLGIVRYRFSEENSFRKYKKSGFISILDFLQSLIIKMFVIDRYNIVIWITIATYYNPDWFTVLCSNFKIINYKAIMNFISIKKVFEQVSGLWWLVVTLVNGYGVYFRISKKIAEENIKKVIEYQEKIEEYLSHIVYLSEKNIDVLGSQVEYFPNYFCQLVTGSDKYLIEDGKLISTRDYNRRDIISIKTLAENYYSYSDDIKKINEILENIKNEGLTTAFNLINKPVMYEVIKLGLYSSETFERIGNGLLQKEYIQEFLENWTDKNYLKERFEEFAEVLSGYKNKSLYEKEYSPRYSLSFDKIVEFAEKELEKNALKFWYMSKYILSNAIECHIMADRYVRKMHDRRKINKLFLKLDTLFSK